MLAEVKEYIIDICQPIVDYCTVLGEPGLFILAFIESSFFPIPPDFLYIPMILGGFEHPYHLAFIATLGSVLGALLGYAIGIFGGRPLAEKFLPHKYIDKADELFENYGSQAILIAAFTPVPFKVFTVAAGMARMRRREFIFYSILGRGGRFFAVTYLLTQFGQVLMENFFKISLLASLAAVVIFFVYKLFFKKKLKFPS